MLLHQKKKKLKMFWMRLITNCLTGLICRLLKYSDLKYTDQTRRWPDNSCSTCGSVQSGRRRDILQGWAWWERTSLMDFKMCHYRIADSEGYLRHSVGAPCCCCFWTTLPILRAFAKHRFCRKVILNIWRTTPLVALLLDSPHLIGICEPEHSPV